MDQKAQFIYIANQDNLLVQHNTYLCQQKNSNVLAIKSLEEVVFSGRLCLALISEYIPGDDLHSFIKKYHDYLIPTTHLKFALKIGNAIRYLHEHRLMHRDIKPANIRVLFTSEPVLVDFGYVKELRTLMNTNCGTPNYMAPEMCNRSIKIEYSESVDIYSYGIMLIHMITGKVPYYGCTLDEIIEKQKEGLPKFDQNHPLATLINKCCSFDPCQRPDIFSVMQQLKEIAKSNPIFTNDPDLAQIINEIEDEESNPQFIRNWYGTYENLVEGARYQYESCIEHLKTLNKEMYDSLMEDNDPAE